MAHTWSDWGYTVLPKCEENGEQMRWCQTDGCGKSETKVVDKLNHSWLDSREEVIAPTCTQNGYTKCYCSREGCDYYFIDTDSIVSALGHNWGEAYASDEFSTGYGHKCIRCGELEELSCPHSSTYSVDDPKATCTAKGVRKYYCNTCDNLIRTEDLVALGHAYPNTWTTEKEANCNATGLMVKVCTNCNDRLEQDIPKNNDHNYKAVVTPATCEKGGYTTHTCTRCNKSYIDDQTEPNGHSYPGGYIVTKEATCTQAGSKYRTCINCGHVDTDTIPATGHTIVESDEFSNGRGCSVCGEEL